MEACLESIRARGQDAREYSVYYPKYICDWFEYEYNINQYKCVTMKAVAGRIRHGSPVGYFESPEIRAIRQEKEAPRILREAEAYAATLGSWTELFDDMEREEQYSYSEWIGFAPNGMRKIIQTLLMRLDASEGLHAFIRVMMKHRIYCALSYIINDFLDAGAVYEPITDIRKSMLWLSETMIEMYYKERAQKRCSVIKEELIQAVWHPDRLARLGDLTWLD